MTSFSPPNIHDVVLILESDPHVERRKQLEQINNNVRWACAQNFPRFEPYDGKRSKPVALVGLGCSLADTWECLQDFDYIISTSGSHRYLLDRGIVPTWHVDVDYREHKIDLMGPPDHRVQYLPASACHRRMFDHLAGHDFRIWTPLLMPQDGEEHIELYQPLGEILVNGGSNVMMRTMFLANLMGFRDLHFFGLDYSYPPEHVGEHVIDHPCKVEETQRRKLKGADGTIYHTTDHYWQWAIEFFILRRFLMDLGMTLTMHGNGMVADLVNKNFTLEDGTTDVSKVPVAMMKHETAEQARAYEQRNLQNV